MFELTNDDKAAFKKLSECLEKQHILSDDAPIFDWQGFTGLSQAVDKRYVDAYNASLLIDPSLDINHLNRTNEAMLKLGLISQDPSMWSACKPDEKLIIAMFKSVFYKIQNEIPQIQLKIFNPIADAAPILAPFVPTPWGKGGYIVILKLFDKYLKTIGNSISDGITIDEAKLLFDIDAISAIDKEQMKALLLSPEAKEYINNLYFEKKIDEKIAKSIQDNNDREKNTSKDNITKQQDDAQKIMINIQHTLGIRLENLTDKSFDQSMPTDNTDNSHKNASQKKVYLMQQAITGLINAYMNIINKQEQNAADKRMLDNMDRYLQEIKIDKELNKAHNFIFNSLTSMYLSNYIARTISGKLIHSNEKLAIAAKYFSMIAQYNASNNYYSEKLSEIQAYKGSLERYYKKQLCILADYTGDYSGLNTADFFTLGAAVIPSLAQYNNNNDLFKFFDGVLLFFRLLQDILMLKIREKLIK